MSSILSVVSAVMFRQFIRIDDLIFEEISSQNPENFAGRTFPSKEKRPSTGPGRTAVRDGACTSTKLIVV